MNKILALYVGSLVNPKHINYMQFVKAAIALYPIIGEKFAKEIARFINALTKEDDIFLKHQRKFLTQEILDKDNLRDVELSLLRDALKMAAREPGEPEKNAMAQRLLDVIELYGGARIANQAMDSESGNLSNLVEDLETVYADQVAALGIGERVEALKSANNKFIEALSKRTLDDADFGKGAMAKARKLTDATYRAMIHSINLAVFYGEGEPLQPFINYLNAEIERYRIQLGVGAGPADSEIEEDFEEELEEEVEEEEGSEEQQPTKFTVTYIKGQYTWMTQQYAAGERIVPPAEPEAFRWVDVPEFMPDHDITIYAQYVG